MSAIMVARELFGIDFIERKYVKINNNRKSYVYATIFLNKFKK